MSFESRLPADGEPLASGPQERRDEFLRARGLDRQGADGPGRRDEWAEDADDGCPDDDVATDRGLGDPEDGSTNS